jgi:hypothetical protein
VDKGLFIDGRLENDFMWANMCAKCFSARGAGIQWGAGQLYAKQSSGEWRMIAGFQPTDQSEEQ